MPEKTESFFADLKSEVEVPEKGILSRTLHNDEHLRVVLFAFAAGEELSAHTAPMPAVLYLVQGEAQWTLGAQTQPAKAGSLAHMPPNLPHSIVAAKPTIMLLLMLKQTQDQAPMATASD